MIITEEAERLAATLEGNAPAPGAVITGYTIAAALRSLAAERDALRAEVERLLGPPIDKAERKKNLVAAGVSEKTADEMLKSPVYDRHFGRASVDPLQAKNARLRKLVAYLAGTNTDHVQVALAGNPIVCDAIHAEARALLGETQ
jgi:hypothetical protein